MTRIDAQSLRFLIAQANGQIENGTSAADTAQQVVIAAPGAGKRNHLTGVVAVYSDNSDHAITITVAGEAIVLNTGTGVNGLMFPPNLQGVDLQGADNGTITIDAVAGGATVTSSVYALYYVESGD
jgi:hypothetical protein